MEFGFVFDPFSYLFNCLSTGEVNQFTSKLSVDMILPLPPSKLFSGFIILPFFLSFTLPLWLSDLL
jgi:hypothetical protein